MKKREEKPRLRHLFCPFMLKEPRTVAEKGDGV